MNSSPSYSIDLLTQTLATQFKGLESEVRIHIGLTNLLNFCCSRKNILYGTENIEMVMKKCGLMNLLNRCPENKKDTLIACIESFILFNYFKKMSLNFEKAGCPFEVEELKFVSGNITTGTTMSGGIGIGVAGGQSSVVTEKNFRKEPTFNKMYVTGHRRIDEFSLASLYLNHYFVKMNSLTEFQRMQVWQLSNFVSNKGSGLLKHMQTLKDTKFTINGQNILADYMTNLLQRNTEVRQALKLTSFVPYMLELNGAPGIGKSTFVNLLASIMTEIFPFIESDGMVYSRVNDKFWNGYHQQPIVLFDDSNQNDKLLFNLDNELISIGSGQFVHPPMAFEKETIFGSSFVIFTTNEKLLNTTRVNQGAVARRIHTVDVLPKSHLGEMIINGDFDQKWTYKRGVRENAFNLTFDGHGPNYIIASFLEKLYKQIGSQTQTLNPFQDMFTMLEEIEDEQQLSDELFAFNQAIGTERAEAIKKAEAEMKMTAEERSRQAVIKSIHDKIEITVHSGDEAVKRTALGMSQAKIVSYVATPRSGYMATYSCKKNTENDMYHSAIDEVYNKRTNLLENKAVTASIGNVFCTFAGSDVRVMIKNNEVFSIYFSSKIGNLESHNLSTKDAEKYLPTIRVILAHLLIKTEEKVGDKFVI